MQRVHGGECACMESTEGCTGVLMAVHRGMGHYLGCSTLQCHRVSELQGLEWTSRDHLVQLPAKTDSLQQVQQYLASRVPRTGMW